jgi:hypothetical protein
MIWHKAPSIGGRVVDELITYVGLDVHKDAVAVAIAEEGKRGEVCRADRNCALRI